MYQFWVKRENKKTRTRKESGKNQVVFRFNFMECARLMEKELTAKLFLSQADKAFCHFAAC